MTSFVESCLGALSESMPREWFRWSCFKTFYGFLIESGPPILKGKLISLVRPGIAVG